MATSPAAKRRVPLMIAAGGLALAVARLLAPAAEIPEHDAPAPSPRGGDGTQRQAMAAPELQVVRLDSLRGAATTDGEGSAAHEGSAADLFAPHSWQPPAPAANAPPPPEPPRAPPFPYAYFGGLTEGGARTGFFIKGNRVVALRTGDVVDSFRIDSLDEQQATLTYLPLAKTSNIIFGSTQ